MVPQTQFIVVWGKIPLNQDMFYIYVLMGAKSRLYIGRSDNLKRRLSEHKDGKVWTTKRMLPVKLIFYEAFVEKNDAIRRERYLKTNQGKKGLKLIARDSLKI